MPIGSPFRTKQEVEKMEAHYTANEILRMWTIGEVRIDMENGRLETWNGKGWTSRMLEPFTKAAVILNPTTSQNIVIWEAPYEANLKNVRAFQNGGTTGSTFNTRKNGTLSHLGGADGTISSLDTWVDGGTVQNIEYAIGDSLEIQIMSVSGSPDYIVIQVEMEQI